MGYHPSAGKVRSWHEWARRMGATSPSSHRSCAGAYGSACSASASNGTRSTCCRGSGRRIGTCCTGCDAATSASAAPCAASVEVNVCERSYIYVVVYLLNACPPQARAACVTHSHFLLPVATERYEYEQGCGCSFNVNFANMSSMVVANIPHALPQDNAS